MSLSMPPDEFDLVKRVNAFVESVKDLPGVVVATAILGVSTAGHDGIEAALERGRREGREAVIRELRTRADNAAASGGAMETAILDRNIALLEASDD